MICKTIFTSYKFPKTSKLQLETRPTITAIALLRTRHVRFVLRTQHVNLRKVGEERIFIEVMTSDRKLEASRGLEKSDLRDLKDLRTQHVNF